ncbi:MAG: phospholipase D-like domain-containing protein [Polyangiaceae bacterium]
MKRSSFAILVLASLALPACGGRAGATSSDPGDASTADDAPTSDAASDDAGSGPTLVTDPDAGMGWFSALLGTAKTSIDMTMYELTDTTITGLLTQAAKNGVTVRVILDQNLEKTDNTPAYNTLSAGGVQVHWANPTYAATHQKTVTIDRITSAIMTMNLTPDDYVTSRDFAVVTTDAADVAAIETVFESDFASMAITPPTGDDLVWSPTNALSSLTGIIQGAKTSLWVENEEMGDDAIVSALSGAASHGVAVNVVMENSKDYQTEFATLTNAGVALATYEHAALYIHAKIIVADYGSTEARAFVGSENFSNASLTENRELGLITSDSTILTSLYTTLHSDYDGGTPFKPSDGGSE